MPSPYRLSTHGLSNGLFASQIALCPLPWGGWKIRTGRSWMDRRGLRGSCPCGIGEGRRAQDGGQDEWRKRM